MAEVVLGDVSLHYERGGSGPPLLFISGTGGDLRVRPNVLDGPLARHFEVLAFDQRGLGRSSVPPGPYTMAQYADDAGTLLEAVGRPPALVVGVSFGGMVAQELALRHPAMVSRLALLCTSAGGRGGASFPLHELADLDPEERTARHLIVSDTRRTPQWRAEHATEWDLLVELAAAQRSVGADEPGRADGARWQLEARRGHDTWDRLGQIACPTLVAGGQFDGIAPPSNQEALARAIPKAELAMFDGGHLFFLQDRSAFPAVIEFLLGATG